MYLEIENYSKVIGNEKVLDHINLRLNQGEIYGLRGKNGSGKTMLLRAICGFIHPTEGKVIVNGKEIGKDFSFPEKTSVSIEGAGFLGNLSAFDNLKLLADINHIISDEEITNTLVRIGLENANKKKYKKFSLGMKQKLGIAAAIMEKPDMILLDEPTNALDEESIDKLRKIIREEKARGALVIIASHDKEELQSLSDHIIEIKAGKIVSIAS